MSVRYTVRAVVCTDGLNLKQRECGPYWHYARLAENVRVRDSILLMESAGLLLPLTEKMLSLAVDGLSEINEAKSEKNKFSDNSLCVIFCSARM